ncbi:acyltransferase family protein [Paramicrobacterium chengjingii]|uniref:Acetyltransferase n=1 Tax=Paramicrobacterium chengjingii TaxID=2769067 RepID=A0ABX6YK84_9MICO|nr:acyltransferase family protein [Microbacterium chengjingii]QPZ39171.1 acetyltransferase [Microbacterium chengjingii]
MVTSASSLPQPAARIHYAGLDGLRALAVAGVLVYHLFPGALPGGFIGVDVFFVISGFLITSLLMREHHTQGRISLSGFWTRRARRIIPALVLVVTASTTIALVIGGDVLVRIGRQILGAATFSYNWVEITTGGSYFDALSPEMFRTLWSLAVEEQFYIVWPLLLLALLLLPSRWLRAGVLVAASIGSALWMAHLFAPGADATRVYYGTDTHAFGLLIGAALAVLLEGRLGAGLPRSNGRATRVTFDVAGTIALVGVGALAFSLGDGDDFTYRGGLALASLLTVIVIAAAIRPRSVLGSRLDAGALRWLGRRSYGVYLWHWPVFTLTLAVSGSTATQAPPVTASLVAIVITLAASELSFRFVETPVRTRGFRDCARALTRAVRTSIPRAAVSIGIVAVALVLVGSTGTAMAVSPQSSSVEQLIANAQKSSQTKTAPPKTPAKSTVTGENITAVGDSVMLAAAPALEDSLPGIDIDASVSRSMYTAPGILEDLEQQGRLRSTVIIGLGTNGPVNESTLDEIVEIIGPERHLILVNAYAPRDWIEGVNAELDSFAAARRTSVIADWSDAIDPRATELLAADRIHPGYEGGTVYAEAIMRSLQVLADLPPAVTEQYGYNLPVVR